MCSCPLASLVASTGLAPVCQRVSCAGGPALDAVLQRSLTSPLQGTELSLELQAAGLGLLRCEATLLAPCRFFSTQVKRSPGTFLQGCLPRQLAPSLYCHTELFYHRYRIYICLTWSSMRFPPALSPACPSHSEQQPCPPAH